MDTILKEQGLNPWNVDHICHIVYRAEKKHFEMHFDISGVPYGKPGELVHKYIEDIFDKSITHTTHSGSMQLPSKFHHGLIILLHTSHHLTGEGIGLRYLCDWAVFLNSCSDEEFKDLFEEKFRAIGMWKFACVLSQICIKYLGCKPKPCLMNINSDISKELIDDILLSGNFGKKDLVNRLYQSSLISDRGKSGINEKSMLFFFIHSKNVSIRRRWRLAKRYPAIILFGWIYFGAKKIIDMIRKGNKVNDIKRTIDLASQRRSIYSKLRIFEPENHQSI